MSQSDLLAKITEVNRMVLEGKALECFEHFYHDSVCKLGKMAKLFMRNFIMEVSSYEPIKKNHPNN